MSMCMYCFIFMFMSGLFVYVSKYKHFLLMLLSLEFAVLSLFILILISLSFVSYENFLCMFFLSMSVCESVLGLSLLVLVVRNHGSDMIMMFDNLW
uniref:NADH-ubiquinone oxidoreductase chain 4L n=1 Tax=Trigonopterus sp. 4 AH-2016 TaxID=1903838 RepID=A0A343C420_9CUCU|nr:NADH dehydrogenase subunit 4L [Trigonopterus sp. 4 AH-2016]